MWQCSQQHENREEAKFCAKCGDKRVERVVCSSCNAVMEPDDAFCVACGQKREGAPSMGAVSSRVEALPLPPPVRIPEPTPTAPAPLPAAAPVPPAAPAPLPASEDAFSFSFGGTTIGAQTPVKKTKKSKGPMATGIVSFVAFGVLLLIALYLLSR